MVWLIFWAGGLTCRKQQCGVWVGRAVCGSCDSPGVRSCPLCHLVGRAGGLWCPPGRPRTSLRQGRGWVWAELCLTALGSSSQLQDCLQFILEKQSWGKSYEQNLHEQLWGAAGESVSGHRWFIVLEDLYAPSAKRTNVTAGISVYLNGLASSAAAVLAP